VLAFVAASLGRRQGGWGGDSARLSRWASLLCRSGERSPLQRMFGDVTLRTRRCWRPATTLRRRRRSFSPTQTPSIVSSDSFNFHLRPRGRRRSRPVGGRAHGYGRGVGRRRGHVQSLSSRSRLSPPTASTEASAVGPSSARKPLPVVARSAADSHAAPCLPP